MMHSCVRCSLVLLLLFSSTCFSSDEDDSTPDEECTTANIMTQLQAGTVVDVYCKSQGESDGTFIRAFLENFTQPINKLSIIGPDSDVGLTISADLFAEITNLAPVTLDLISVFLSTDRSRQANLPRMFHSVRELNISLCVTTQSNELFFDLSQYPMLQRATSQNNHYSIDEIILEALTYVNATNCYKLLAPEAAIRGSHCVCTSNVTNQTLINVYCVEGSALEMMELQNLTAESKRIIETVQIFNLQFLDTGDEVTIDSEGTPFNASALYGREHSTPVLSTAPYPTSFAVYTCAPNPDPWRARRELRKVYFNFNGLDDYLQNITMFNCSTLDPVLSAADGERRENGANFVPQAMTPILVGYVSYVDLRSNRLTEKDFLNHFRFSLDRSQLRELNLHDNVFVNVSSEFGFRLNARHLQKLDFSVNKIADMADDAFRDFATLEWLDLSSNQLPFIKHSWFSSLESLKYLNLNANKIKGAYYVTRTRFYPAIWPTSLEYLDLSENSLIDQRDFVFGGTQNVHFDALFFMGLSNLVELNLRYTKGCLTSEYFLPMRSLQHLNMADGRRFDMIDKQTMNIYCNITQDYFHNVPTLRTLNLFNSTFPPSSNLSVKPCQVFHDTPLLMELNLAPDSESKETWPLCENVSTLRVWINQMEQDVSLKRSIKFACNDESYSDINGTSSHQNDEDMHDHTLAPEDEEIPVESLANVAPENKPSTTWPQVRDPIIVLLVLSFIVLVIAMPGNCARIKIHYTSLKERMSYRSKKVKKANHASQTSIHLDDLAYKNSEMSQPPQAKPEGKRTKLRSEFFSSTLINGFAYAYDATWVFEKILWYVLILVFLGLFMNDAAKLWVQWQYGDPQTSVDMKNSPTFAQRAFTMCMPLQQRNINLTARDIKLLISPNVCARNKSDTAALLERDLLWEAILNKIGLQFAWEGAVLEGNISIPDYTQELDNVLKAAGLTYRQALIRASQAICERMNITAYKEDKETGKILNVTLNYGGCQKLFANESFGISFWDPNETKQFCVRFPGLFEFDGYRFAGVLKFSPLNIFYKTTPTDLDFQGYVYRKSAGKSLIPVPANIYHDNTLNIQLKHVIRTLKTYRSLKDRCYEDCIGETRIAEIQSQCKCRPFMWPTLSDTKLPDCSLETYTKCNLSTAGTNLDKCSNSIPCENWEYAVDTADGGLTADNSTVIRFNGINTLYIAYSEQEARSVSNFIGDVGGTLGLWLGASLMAAIHVLVFFIKLIIYAIPWPCWKLEDDEKDEPGYNAAA